MECEGGDNSLIINILQIIQPGEVSVIGDGFIFERHTYVNDAVTLFKR